MRSPATFAVVVRAIILLLLLNCSSDGGDTLARRQRDEATRAPLLYAFRAADTGKLLKKRAGCELAACNILASSPCAARSLIEGVTHHFAGSKGILQQPGSRTGGRRTRTGKASAGSEQTQSTLWEQPSASRSSSGKRALLRTNRVTKQPSAARSSDKTQWPTTPDGEVEDDADRARVRRSATVSAGCGPRAASPQSAGRIIKLLRELDAAPRQGARSRPACPRVTPAPRP